MDNPILSLTPKNWHTFQHYNKRNPPWIKLHRSLLNDYEFSQLPVESRALAPMLWLIASESWDGCINLASTALAFRLHTTTKELLAALNPLVINGFFVDASNVLAECKQHATPETETETEKEVPPPPSVEEVQEGKGKVVVPRPRRKGIKTDSLRPFSEWTRCIIEDLVPVWHREDGPDNDRRRIVVSVPLMGENLEEIKREHPGLPMDVVVAAGKKYLSETKMRYKAPQYFFGEKGPWVGYIRNEMTRREMDEKRVTLPTAEVANG